LGTEIKPIPKVIDPRLYVAEYQTEDKFENADIKALTELQQQQQQQQQQKEQQLQDAKQSLQQVQPPMQQLLQAQP
jgi:hypothetical protein